MEITPIGTFHCAETYTYDAARQGVLAEQSTGRVELVNGQHFEQALQDLEGFSHLWLLFQFHKNSHWKPLVQPPRGGKKVGVLASRAPYRPNGIGMSCVRLVSVRGRTVEVAGHDLLDGTPILDIKPYIPYADSFPEATGGWTDALEGEAWSVAQSVTAASQLAWLAAHGVVALEGFLVQQLGDEPFNEKRKRLRDLGDGVWEIAYRTWRARFRADEASRRVTVIAITSGYASAELRRNEDPYEDKHIHRDFAAAFAAWEE